MLDYATGRFRVLTVCRFTYLNNEHDDEHKDEGSVEVRDVEGGAEASDERVAANDNGKEHGGQLGAEVLDQGVEDSGPGNGERHHDDEVGEEGEAAEDNVCVRAKASLDHLKLIYFSANRIFKE